MAYSDNEDNENVRCHLEDTYGIKSNFVLTTASTPSVVSL